MARAPKKKADTKPADGEKVNKHQDLRAKTHDELVDQLVTLKVILPRERDTALTDFIKEWNEKYGYTVKRHPGDPG